MKKLAQREWVEAFRLVPRVAVDLVVKRGNKVLLTKRKRTPFVGWWHIPGSFLLKDERLAECVERIAKEELGVRVEKVVLVGVYENLNGDPRGHVIDVVYKGETTNEVRAVGDTAEIGWFNVIPENFGFGQETILRDLGLR